MTSIQDRNLNTIDLSYDGNGRLSTILAPGSRSLTLGYNADNRISTLSDSAGRSVTYGYNPATGDLTNVTNALNGPTTYQYSGHLLTQATDPNNHLSVRNTYDGRVRVIQQLDPVNAPMAFSYSTPGNGATRVTDPKGYQTTHYFDTSMRITNVMDHNGGITTIGYDSDNNSATTTNPLLKSWTRTYDLNGNVLTETDPLRQPYGNAESGVDGCGNKGTGDGQDDDGDDRFDDGCPNIKSTYTSNNDPDLQTDPLGRQVDYIYNSTGNLTRLVRLDHNGEVKALTCFEVEGSGLVTASVQSTNLLVPAGPTDPCTGHRTLYGYDAAGNQTCVVNPRFSATTTCASDPGRKSTFIYDLAGRLIYATDEITNNIRPVRGTAPETGDQCGPGSGDLVDQDSDGTSDDGCPSVSYTYDALGNVLTQQDELGNTTSNIYDSKGILIKSLDAKRYPRGTPETGPDQCGALGTGNGGDDETPSDGWPDDGCPSVIYSYDSADRLIEVLDAMGGRTTYGYDAAWNQTSVTSPRSPVRPVGTNGPETSAQCGPTGFGDGVNNDAAVDDAVADDGCPSTFYAFDSLHRLQSETNSLGHTTSYTYDSASNPQQRTDARGLLTKYFWDEANRPDRVEHWNGGTPVDSVDFTLDIAGNRLQMADPSGTTKYAYDALDRPICLGPNTISGPCPSGNVAYQYDDLPGGSTADYPGQRTKITYPDGKYVDYTYLADGSMSSVTDWLTKQTTYEYNDAGALTKKIYPNNTCTIYVYDHDGNRLISNENRRMAAPPTCSPSDTVMSAFTYVWDAVGNRKDMGELGGVHYYQYDALHRLTQVTYPGPQTDTYTYDANGNRLSKNASSYSYNAADQMTLAAGVSYGYDNNGNQTTRASDTFTYDHENQLTQSVISGASSSSVYNGDGLRMSHTVSGQTTNYTWDTAAALPVILQDGTNTYVYGLDLISATDNGGAQTYFLNDGLGSTTDLVDGSANVIGTYRYDVFGAIRSQTGSSPNHWLFTGEQRDSDSGFYYLRARYYDPSIGRFVSMDPLGEGNGYSYVLNNPVNLVDPYGLLGCRDLAPDKYCEWGEDRWEDVKNAGETAVNAAESCWNNQICRTIGVSIGVAVCSAATSPTVWGPVACAAAGGLVLSYEEAVECAGGSTVSCVNVGVNVGISVAAAGIGGHSIRGLIRPREIHIGKHWRIAPPFGNSKVRWVFPHYHRPEFDAAGKVIQSRLRIHRPYWKGKWYGW